MSTAKVSREFSYCGPFPWQCGYGWCTHLRQRVMPGDRAVIIEENGHVWVCHAEYCGTLAPLFVP